MVGKLNDIAVEDIIVRPAQLEDKTAVLSFCQHTWSDTEDYIAAVWDQWMAEPSGQILVAVLEDQPVAITRVVQLSKHEGWWEALRVDPKYRGRGLVRHLDPAIEHYFRAKGISIIRCCVASWNSTVPAMIQRRGYQPLACYLEYSAEAIEAPIGELNQLRESDRAVVVQLIDQSHGTAPLFVCRGAKWQRLNIEVLQERLQAGKVWGYWQGSELQGVLIQSHLESADSALWVGWIGGTVVGLPGLLKKMRHLAFHLEYPQVSGFFPKTSYLQSVLGQVGYSASPTDEFWVYEKSW
jgi:GNAT superfamily N-acetyltransferase